MKISKKVPVIAAVCLCMVWGFIGCVGAVKSTDDKTAGPLYTRKVTLAEDVTVVDVSKEIDAAMNKEPFTPAELKAGISGTVYFNGAQIINDPYKGRHAFRADFYQNGETYSISLVCGPESDLAANEIHITKIGSYQDFLSENNQKYREENKLVRVYVPRILIGIAIGALFSIIFWIECIIANKVEMHPAVFGIVCFHDLLLMIYPAFLLIFA